MPRNTASRILRNVNHLKEENLQYFKSCLPTMYSSNYFCLSLSGSLGQYFPFPPTFAMWSSHQELPAERKENRLRKSLLPPLTEDPVTARTVSKRNPSRHMAPFVRTPGSHTRRRSVHCSTSASSSTFLARLVAMVALSETNLDSLLFCQ